LSVVPISFLSRPDSNKKAGTEYLGYFGNPAVSVRPCRLSAPPSRMVEYYRYHQGRRHDISPVRRHPVSVFNSAGL